METQTKFRKSTGRGDTCQFRFEPDDSGRIAELCGQFNQHLRQIEQRLGVDIRLRGNLVTVFGDRESTGAVENLLKRLYSQTGQTSLLTAETVHLYLQESAVRQLVTDQTSREVVLRLRKSTIVPRGENQQNYIRSILTHDINFGVGPAGTGKTWLAVAAAVQALENEEIQRILLVRPAVEAGEKLGFLPGDLAQKVDPYLRPLYDALYEMLGFERVGKLIEKSVIEVAPLAFMRGRTLNNAYIIMDEAQNTTKEQMKMFLTRIGYGSTAVVTGDITQIDLPRETQSGLKHALGVLRDVEGIGFTWFSASDVVRHPIVQRIVRAYDRQSAVDRNRAARDG